MSDVARVKAPLSRAGAFALVVFIFLGLGPLVGSLALWIFVSAGRIANTGIGASDPVGYFSALAAVLFFGYLVGMVFALIAGLVVGLAGIFLRWNNVLVAVAAAAVASLTGPLIPWLYSRLLTGQFDAVGIFPICLVAAFACWYVTRGIVRATWQSA